MKKKIFFAFAVLGMTAVLLTGCGKADPSECVHEFGAWAVEVEPGCEIEGTQTHSCTECGYEEKEIVRLSIRLWKQPVPSMAKQKEAIAQLAVRFL